MAVEQLSRNGGTESPLAGVYVDWILTAFGDDRGKAIDEYKKFVANGKGLPSPWQDLKYRIYMGSEQFVSGMQQEIDLTQRLDEFPASQHKPPPLPLVHYASTAADRDEAILQAYQSGGYTLQAIGNHFSLYYSRVSRIVSRAKKQDLTLITRSTAQRQ